MPAAAVSAPPAQVARPEPAGKPQKSSLRDERNTVMAEARAAWEELRPKAVDGEKTARLVAKLFALLQGRVVEFVFRHDGSRIVQWMLGDGDDKQVAALMDELLLGARADVEGGAETPFFVKLSGDRYGRHLAMKMLRVSVRSTRFRGVIFETCLKGNASVMIRNSYGADVLDFAYQTTLNAAQRAQLVVELLFSRERKVFAVVQSKLAGREDYVAKPSFAVALAECGDEFERMVVDNAGGALAAFVDKPALARLAVVHAALDEYLSLLVAKYPPEKARELCALLAPSLVHLAHTKPGVSCAITCVKVLDAKHRKKVVRSLKGHIRALVTDECGHRLLLALMEWVDDTKLVGKAFTVEIFSPTKMTAELATQQEEDAGDGGAPVDKRIKPGRVPKPKKNDGDGAMDVDIASGSVDVEYVKSLLLHKHGRMIVLSLLFPRDTRYFHPALYGQSWEAVDEEKFGNTSKKEPATRRAELWSQFADAVRQVIEGSCQELLQSHWSAPVLIGAMLQDELKETAVTGLVAVLGKVLSGNSEEADKLRASVCAQKTISAVLKVGGDDLASAFISAYGEEVVAELGSIERWAATACRLLASTGSRDAAKLVIKARSDIEAACGVAGERLVGEAEELKKAKKQRN